MPTPCPPCALTQCFGPFPVEIRLTLPPGYTDRMLPQDRYTSASEVASTLAASYHQHPAELVVRRRDGSALGSVFCGATGVHQPWIRSGPPPLPTQWIVDAHLYATAFPPGYRDRVPELVAHWVGTLRSVALPEGQGAIGIAVVGMWAGPAEVPVAP